MIFGYIIIAIILGLLWGSYISTDKPPFNLKQFEWIIGFSVIALLFFSGSLLNAFILISTFVIAMLIYDKVFASNKTKRN